MQHDIRDTCEDVFTVQKMEAEDERRKNRICTKINYNKTFT